MFSPREVAKGGSRCRSLITASKTITAVGYPVENAVTTDDSFQQSFWWLCFAVLRYFLYLCNTIVAVDCGTLIDDDNQLFNHLTHCQYPVTPMQSKSQLRLVYKSKRSQLGAEERRLRSGKIAEKALDFLSHKIEIQHIHIFLPIKRLHEIDTMFLIKKLQRKGKDVYTSVPDFENQGMSVVKITDARSFVEDVHGIPIPFPAEETDKGVLQLVFLPLLAYDLGGHRLGYGKGFYDRFLASLSGDVLKIGLSFFPPEEGIPVERHDFPMDGCISPNRIIEF